jgi:hypothetical protein
MVATRSLGACFALTLALAACSKRANDVPDSAAVASTAQVANPNAPIMLRGTVSTVSTTELSLKSDTGIATVKLAQPFTVYARVPSDLSKVKETSFIGVTTVKQPDGSERATEIHVFPEELRGLGEGSRMMALDTSVSASRMTNGSVSASRMTNGAVSQSRMSNGNVSKTDGSTMVVQYAGGSQSVTVPPNTPVTEFKVTPKPLAVGDRISLMAKKAADGSLTADKALSTAK